MTTGTYAAEPGRRGALPSPGRTALCLLPGRSLRVALVTFAALGSPLAGNPVTAQGLTSEGLTAPGLAGPSTPAHLPLLRSTQVAQRLAVIVGNAEYSSLEGYPAAAPTAALMADLLDDLGYRVVHHTDVTRAGFDRLVARLLKEVTPTTDIVFYYAGHGIHVADQNFLIPSDAKMAGAWDLIDEVLPLNELVSIVGARARSQVVLIDGGPRSDLAGRLAGPDRANLTLAIQPGFSFQYAPINSLVAFSTTPGAALPDGQPTDPGKASLFAAALEGSVRAHPGEDLGALLTRVRGDVYVATEGTQIPWESSSLLVPVYLDDAAGAVPQAQPAQQIFDVVAPAEPPALTVIGDSAVISARLEKEVELGDWPAVILPEGTEPVRLVGRPQQGHLGLVGRGPMQRLRQGDTILAQDLPRLRYFPWLAARPDPDAAPGAAPAAQSHTDSFTLARGAIEGTLTLDLTLHDCDRYAAGLLDPQGVGPGVDNVGLQVSAALAACTEAVAAFPDVARFHYQQSRALKAAGRGAESDAAVARAYQMGHIRAITGMGTAVVERPRRTCGTSPGPLAPEAMAYFQAAQQQGDPGVDYILGKQYLRFGEDAATRDRGYRMLQRARTAGIHEALAELGAYYLADGPEQNVERAVSLLEDGARLKNAAAQRALGIVLRRGLAGVTPDLARAETLLSEAVAAGDPLAASHLGVILQDKARSGADFRAALDIYDRGFDKGDPVAGLRAARLLYDGKVPDTGRAESSAYTARAAMLCWSSVAGIAERDLQRFTEQEVAAGAQVLLNDLGQSVTVDGAFGPGSRAALRQVMGGDAEGLQTPGDILRGLAEAYWRANPFRADLY